MAGAASESNRGIRSRALKASWFTLSGYGFSQLLRIGSNMALTRLLFPEAFGLMALVNVLVAGLEMLSDIGIQPSIVQHERGEDRTFLNTAWSIQVMRGFVLWAIGLGIAIPYARLYDRPELAMLVMAVTAGAAISGFKSTKVALLSRRMEMGRVVLIDLVSQIVAIVVMIGVAWLYQTVWALVLGNLVQALSRTLLSHLAIRGPGDRPRWERAAALDIIHFGKWIFLSTLVTFLALRLDTLLLGRLLPLDLLGIYSIAGILAQLPQRIAGRLTNAVLFPALAAAAHEDRQRLPAALAEVRRILLPTAMLCVLGIAALGPAFFRILYDARYHGAGWMAQLLSVNVWFGLLVHLSSRTLLAVGDSRSLAISNGVRLAATITGCLIGYRIAGLPGLILGVATGTLAGYLSQLLAMEQHGLRTAQSDAAHTLLAALLGIIAGVGPLLVARSIPPDDPLLYELTFGAVAVLPVAIVTLSRARKLVGSTR